WFVEWGKAGGVPDLGVGVGAGAAGGFHPPAALDRGGSRPARTFTLPRQPRLRPHAIQRQAQVRREVDLLAVRPAGTFNRGPSGSTIQSRQSDDYLGRRQVLHRATWALDSATCEVPALTRRLVRPLAVTQRHEREVQAGGELVPTQPRLNRRSHQTTGSAGGCRINPSGVSFLVHR